jgi:hypothetical protein
MKIMMTECIALIFTMILPASNGFYLEPPAGLTVRHSNIYSAAPPSPPPPFPLYSSSDIQEAEISIHLPDVEFEMLLPNQSHLAEDPSTPPSDTLQQRGVVRVNAGISTGTALKLQEYIDRTLQDTMDEVASFRVPKSFRFANVLEKRNRWDLLLPFQADDDDGDMEESIAVMQALDELLGVDGKLGPIFENLLGPDAVLYELACLISDPGSQRQEVHPDILIDENNSDGVDTSSIPVIACFVSLQDVDATMGPTLFLPDTVTADHQRRINNAETAKEMLQTIPSVISTLDAGDCSLYDPRVLHAGGANESSRRRRLFYITFLNQAGQDMSHDLNPGSIQPELKKKALTLRQMRGALATWRRNAIISK